MTGLTNREILLRTAADLFRRKGYHGVGLAEILAESGLPKGSLYYHFPGGKRELAEAATLLAGGMVEKLVHRAFADVATFEDGVQTLCHAFGGLVAAGKACPVASILQASAEEPQLHATARSVLTNWTSCLEQHAHRLGHPAPKTSADLLLMQLEGAWLLSLAEQTAAPFARVAAAWRAAPVPAKRRAVSRSRPVRA